MADALTRVMDIVAALSRETTGVRAPDIRPEISLERELGLGSLERAELLSRLEGAFERRLDESLLRADTPRELADALDASPVDDAGTAAAGGTGPGPAAPVAGVGPATEMTGFTSLCDALQRRAEATPDRPHVYMREDDGPEKTLTYLDLLNLARNIGGGLRERGVRRGDTVALMLPTGSAFLGAFQGILAAGAVPVPIYPPARLDRLREYLERQSAILADASAAVLITVARAVPVAEVLRSRVASLRHIVTAEQLADTARPLESFDARGGDAAFIQYTSGSTGAPKGVLLSHDNLLANIRGIGTAFGRSPTTSASAGCRSTTTWASSARGSSACAAACPSTSSRHCPSWCGRSAGCGPSTAGAARFRRRPTSPTSCACARSATPTSRGSTSAPGAAR